MSRTYIDNIIQNIDIQKNKEKFIKYKSLFDDVRKFIIKKKYMLYGGYAINLLLPKKYKFYKDYTLNDYDCYSIDAENDSYELASFLLKKGYKYIQVKKAQHQDTFKVYAEFIQIIDITHLDKDIYNSLYQISLIERKTNIYKYFKDLDLYIVPYMFLKRNLYYEMARPNESSFRWEKIYKRLKILNSKIKNKKIVSKFDKFIPIPSELKKIIKIIFNYIKINNIPIIGTYCLKLYKISNDKNCCLVHPAGNFNTIISIDIDKTTKDIVKLLNNSIDKKMYKVSVLTRSLYTEILYKRNRIVIENILTGYNFTIINIIDTKNECLSVIKKGSYTVGTIYTILFYFYSLYIIYASFSTNNTTILDETLYYINLFENKINNIKIKDKITKKCYGNIIERNDILKKNWNVKATLLKK